MSRPLVLVSIPSILLTQRRPDKSSNWWMIFMTKRVCANRSIRVANQSPARAMNPSAGYRE